MFWDEIKHHSSVIKFNYFLPKDRWDFPPSSKWPKIWFGNVQFSKDSFSTCHQMNGTPSVSSDGKTFTVGYKDLTAETTYKLRVTTGVKDNSGNLNAMSSQYETQNGCHD